MKKLMIAAAIVCAAAMSQAAMVTWQVKNIYNEAGTAKITSDAGYKVYLFTTAAASLDSWDSITSSSDLATALGKGYEIALTAAGNADTSDGSGVSHTTLAPLVLNAGSQYDFYAVAVNAGNSAFYVSTSDDGRTISTEPSDIVGVTLGSQANYTNITKTETYVGWQTVPEPTSGLLLLLGVAGLALRRRRA